MTLPAELTPRRHGFVPDRLTKGDTCLVCGEVDAFGGLHIAKPVAVDDDPPLPRLCADCPHFQHRGRCHGAFPAYPEPKPCTCEAS